MTEEERTELQLAEDVCRRFLACDLTAEQEIGAKELLARVLWRSEEQDSQHEMQD